MQPHPLERILRDWHFYSKHEDLNLILTRIGERIVTGQTTFSPKSVGIRGVYDSIGDRTVKSNR